MAVTQGNVLQQPPGAAQPGPAPSSGPESQSGASNLSPAQAPATPPTPGPQASQGPATGGQTQSSDLNFSQILEQHITQAIQPVLEEFRQQMAQEVAQQTAAAPLSGSSRQHAGQAPPQGQGAQVQAPTPVQQPAIQQPPAQQAPVQPAGAQSAPQQLAGQATQTLQQTPLSQPVAQLQQAAPAVSPGQPGTLPSAQDGQRPLAGALAPVLRTVERQGEQWLQSLLVAGLGALLTESARAAVEQRAQQALHALLQKMFEAAPDGVTNQEMLRKTEGTLQLILREALDAVFAEGMRATMQQGGQQAVQQSLHGDFGSALKRMEDALKVMADALLAVLRRHQQTVLRLSLALALLAIESSLVQPEKPK